MTYPQQRIDGDHNIVAGRDVIVNRIDLRPLQSNDERALRLLSQRVDKFWVRGVLESSIHGASLLDLHGDGRPGAIDHPWATVVSTGSDGPTRLSENESIITIFEDHSRSLLILGEPGSGKTTMLLSIARHLLAASEEEGDAGLVVLSLSTWAADDRSLIEWANRELGARYSVPPKIGRKWLDEGRLSLLLDGLDEVNAEWRARCVAAINRYNAGSGLVVTSRVTEYAALPERLRLMAAIELLPLTREQVLQYVERLGAPLAALHRAITTDPEFEALASSPLMLSVMTLAFRNAAPGALDSTMCAAPQERRNLVFSKYVEHMLQRRAGQFRPELRDQVRPTLACIARKMKSHGATLFAVDQLQPSWLSDAKSRLRYLCVSRGLVSLLGNALAASVVALGFVLVGTPDVFAYWSLGVLAVTVLSIPSTAMAAFLTNRAWGAPSTFGEAERAAGWNQRLLGIPLWSLAPIVGLGGVAFWQRAHGSSSNDIRLLAVWQWSWSSIRARAAKWLWRPARIAAFIGLVAWATVAMTLPLVAEATFPQALFRGLIIGLVFPVFSLACTLPGTLIIGGFSRVDVDREDADLGVRRALNAAMVSALVVCALAGTLALAAYLTEVPELLQLAVLAGVGGANAVFVNGGFDVIAHLVLRQMLKHEGIPTRLRGHLDAGLRSVLLQRVGGSYRFVHVLLRDMLAEEASERSSSRVKIRFSE